MDLSSVFNFEKSRVAIANLEEVLKCKKCNEFYKNPRKHSDCGYLLCECSSNSGVCPYCKGHCSLSKTSTAYQVNYIIEATKTLKTLISPKVPINTESKDNIVSKSNNNSEDRADIVTANPGVKDTKNGKVSDDFKFPNNEPLIKKENVNIQSPDLEKKKIKSTKSFGRQTKTGKNEEARTSNSNIVKPSEIKEVATNIKVILKRNYKGETKLHTACVKGDAEKVEEFLRAGADPCTKDYAGWTPLHEAVCKGHNDIVRMLLEAGALVNVPGYYNNTPLHDAALNNKVEAARLLIAFGANPHLRNLEGFTPVSMAQSKEMELILKEFNPDKIVSKQIKSHCNLQEVVLYGVNLSAKDQKRLNNVVTQFKLKQVSSYKNDVTHIIVSTTDKICNTTVDVFHGILEGKWIVDSLWLCSCLNSNALVDPTEYEIKGTKKFPDSFAPRRGRENAEKMLPSIFSGCHFYFSGVDKITVGEEKFTRAQLAALAVSGKGETLTREPNPESIPAHECTVPYHAKRSLINCSHFVVYQPKHHEPQLKYNMSHVKTLPVSWFLDCIETFTLIEN